MNVQLTLVCPTLVANVFFKVKFTQKRGAHDIAQIDSFTNKSCFEGFFTHVHRLSYVCLGLLLFWCKVEPRVSIEHRILMIDRPYYDSIY